MGRVISIIHFADYGADLVRDPTIAPEPIIAQFDYTYNNAGQRITAIENFDTDSDGDFDITHEFDWDYDALDRLIEEIHDGTGTGSGDDYTTTYSFDLVGNRVSMTTDSSDALKDRTVTYTYDDNDRLLTETSDAVTGDDTHTIYSWGNATGTVGGTATQQTGKKVWESLDTSGDVLETVTYAYNLQGRLAQATIVKGGDTTVLDYTYDDSGIRVSQTETVNAGTPVVTQYLVDHNNHTGYQQVLEEFIDAVLAKSYTIGLDVLAQTNAGTTPDTYQFLYDAHGSTRALLNNLAAIAENASAGDALQLFTYDAYGNALGFDTAAALTSLLYSGEQFDQNLAMQYLRARYYDASTGRFNRVDPFAGTFGNPQSLHKYLYTHGSPIIATDPTGQWTYVGLLTGIGIGSTLLAISLPFAGAAYLHMTGAIDLIDTIGFLGTPSTWLMAFAGLMAGSALSAAAKAGLLYAMGPALARKAVPFVNAGAGMYALYQSAKQTLKMVTGELPRKDAEQFIAVMMAGTIMRALVSGIANRIVGSGKNDDQYFNSSINTQKAYVEGQRLLSTKSWDGLARKGLDGQSFSGVVARGSHLLQTPPGTGEFGRGIYDLLRNTISGNGGMTLRQWIYSGLTPDARLIMSHNASGTFAGLLSIDEILDFIDDLFY